MVGKKQEDWIQTFDKYLSSALDPKAKQELREQYKIWIKNKGKLYSDLQALWPEIVDLLHIIETNIGLQIELKPEDKPASKPEKEIPKVKKEPDKKEPVKDAGNTDTEIKKGKKDESI